MTVRTLDQVSGFPPSVGLVMFAGGHWLAVVTGFAGLGMMRSLSIVTGLVGLIVFLVAAD